MNAMEKAIDLLLCIGILFLIPLLYFLIHIYNFL